jgi:hypothetical protein
MFTRLSDMVLNSESNLFWLEVSRYYYYYVHTPE